MTLQQIMLEMRFRMLFYFGTLLTVTVPYLFVWAVLIILKTNSEIGLFMNTLTIHLHACLKFQIVKDIPFHIPPTPPPPTERERPHNDGQGNVTDL